MSRISPGTILVGIFAVLFGLFGAYAVRQYLTAEPEVAEAPQRPRTILVPTASVDLEAGRPLTMGDVAMMRLTEEQAAERNLPADRMSNPQQIFGRILREPLAQGEVFRTVDFFPQGMGPSVAERLKPGQVAMTIPVTSTGLSMPGSIVDILFRTMPGVDQIAQTTVTLLEKVEVLAMGNNQVPGQRGNGSNTSVTFAVTPAQAQALEVVKDRGELSLALRGEEELAFSVTPEPQTLTSLLGLNPPTIETEVYRGGQLHVNKFRTHESNPLAFIRLPIPANETTPTRFEGTQNDNAPAAPRQQAAPAGTNDAPPAEGENDFSARADAPRLLQPGALGPFPGL